MAKHDNEFPHIQQPPSCPHYWTVTDKKTGESRELVGMTAWRVWAMYLQHRNFSEFKFKMGEPAGG